MLNFIVVGMPRTRSTLLLTGLAQHPEITAFGELFHAVPTERTVAHAITRDGERIFFDSDRDDAIEFLKSKVFPAARAGSKAVGFKLFAELVQCRGTEKLFMRLKSAFPDLRIIHIVRSNYLEVLASREVATATRCWVQYAGQKRSDVQRRVRIQPERARVFFARMKEADRFFEVFFGGGNYLRIDSQTLARDFGGEMKRAYRFLGVSDFEPVPQVEKQVSSSLVDLIENYGELRKAFSGTEYHSFFPPSEVAPRSRMLPLEFISETEMRIGDVTFDLDSSSAVKNKFSAGRRFVMMKMRKLVTEYKRIFDELAPTNLIELGIRRGGSMAFYNLAFCPQTHVAIEIEKEPIPALNEIIDRAKSEGRRMRPLYGVDQGDKKQLLEIVRREFDGGDRPLDMVIDDASHKLDLSTASFEALFPLLREGGVYAVEDWGWAHWAGFQGANAYFANEPALTNLIFQLLILHTCQPEIIKQITVTPVVAFVERGPKLLDPLQFRIANHLIMRGKQLPRI